MMRAAFAFLAAACIALSVGSSQAAAQHDEQLEEPPRDYSSTERLTLELRIGPYQPDLEAFDQFFGDDDGLMLALELDVIAFRLKDILYLSGGGIVGWANYKGVAVDDDGVDTSEETELEIFPLSLLGVIRFDVLPRKLGVPIILTGKLGYTWMNWSTETGGADSASGWSLGYQWAGQVALDLDSFDLAAARVMDEEWGINHSFLFLEIFGFEPQGDSLDLGGTSWAAGLGFVM
jgi:hypothetical protein